MSLRVLLTQRSQTVMHLAAEIANVDLVEMLLKAGPDLTIRDKVRPADIM